MQTIIAKVETKLKKRPVDSAQLQPGEFLVVSTGKSYGIVFEEPAENGHTKVILAANSGTFYAFNKHWEGLDGGTLHLDAIPSEWKSAAKPYVSILVKAFQDAGIVSPRVLAYACATIGNESSWNPKAENKTDPYAGTPWSGKGLAQVTTPENYKALTQKTGIDFVNQPELMFDPYSSLRAKAAFYQMNHLIPYIEQGDYESAAGMYNAGDPNYRSDYTRRVAQQTSQWERVFS